MHSASSDRRRYVISCLDVGGECDFVATGETPIEVKRAVWGHVRERHSDLGLTAVDAGAASVDDPGSAGCSKLLLFRPHKL